MTRTIAACVLAASLFMPIRNEVRDDIESPVDLALSASAEAAREPDPEETELVTVDLALESDGAAGVDDWLAPDDDPPPIAAPHRWDASDVLAALSQATPRARCVVRSEVGGYGYSPWVIGAQGERGPVQLHPRGLLADYLRWSGGEAPENPYVSIPYLDWMLARGQGRHWSAILRGTC